MENTIKKIKKRDGKIVDFDLNKISNAIFKAFDAVGEADGELAKGIAEKVLSEIKSKIKENEIPNVEQIQDIVEQVLVGEGKIKAAKAYIVYRQKRTEIRNEKQQILEKDEIDEVDKTFDINALRVLKSRYLKKDEGGKLIESPKQLFQRVATHVIIPSLLYDKKVFQKEVGSPKPAVKIDKVGLENKLAVGEYKFNRFHIEGLERLYNRLNAEGKMKVSLSQIIDWLKNGKFDSYQEEIDSYYELMATRKFMPNTPALVNFGNYLGMGSACFVVSVEDSIESIMSALKKSALIFKAGGGVGYNFSNLRPEGDFVKTTGGVSSGPISFMSLFDKMTDVIKQGGVRRGASIGILDSNHPDIEKFVTAKKGNLRLKNFNISVFIKEDFWQYYREKKPYPLINPRNGEIVKYIDPETLLDLIVYQAWESAEPGVIFEEILNKHNPFLKTRGPIRATNPCGELPLYPDESCNLGSINVWAFAKRGIENGNGKIAEFDWEEFKRTITLATRFLDNVIDINKYPLPEIEKMTLSSRKIGLGMMGLADLLFELEIPYNSPEGLSFMEKIMEFMNFYSKKESVILAEERGVFPAYKDSFYPEGKLPFGGLESRKNSLPLKEEGEGTLNWQEILEGIKKFGIRNSQTTTNVPTGSTSMLAGCSSGIEPVFSLVFEKKVVVGSFYYVDPVFEKAMMRKGLLDDDLIVDVVDSGGGISKLSYIPKKLKKVFATAMDISAEGHIRALAALQKWTDASISKTINFPAEATITEMKKAYLLAHELGCKDLAVFRYQSIKGVLEVKAKDGAVKKRKPEKRGREEKKSGEDNDKNSGKLVNLEDAKAKGPSVYKDAGASSVDSTLSINEEEAGITVCPVCGTPLVSKEGCKECPNCGWGLCSL